MKLKLAENIKAFRKERKMTQEQLAEAMGVSISAVYKWESGQSAPEISLIPEIAYLFGVSTDVLLGVEWRSGGAGDALARIRRLIEEKKYEEAVSEAETALKKFPNNFEIVYQAAMAYLEWSHTFDMNGGMKDWQRKAHTRGEEVFKHALELLPQNTDPEISHISLSRQFAEFHEFCTYISRAIDVLKESNICGINDALIGREYVYLHDLEKAEEYLSKAYTTVLRDMDFVILGFADIFARRNDTKNAIACIEWSRKVLQGIQPEGGITELDRYDIHLDLSSALICCAGGDLENARLYMKRTLERTLRFDAVAPEDIKLPVINTLMHIKERQHYANVWIGKPVMEWVRQADLIPDEDEELPGFKALWDEVKKEVLG